jgi:hypothetical protein
MSIKIRKVENIRATTVMHLAAVAPLRELAFASGRVGALAGVL